MTNKKSTKRALLLSALSLLMCVSMLIGSTFAWFTDSVVSGNNKIIAGNLDVELYHSDKADTDDKVDSTTKLFDDVTLWEPGAMVWEKLTVKNLGSLALKYTLTVNVSDVSVVNGKSLADVLEVAVMTEQPTRESIVAAKRQALETFSLKSDEKLEAKTGEDTFYVAIYWAPSANDNDYNVAGEQLYANLGVTLVATQATVESDSFGNNYDDKAVYEDDVQLEAQPWHQLDAVHNDTVVDGGGNTYAADYQEVCLAGNADITIKGVTFQNGLTLYTNNTNSTGTITLEDCVIYLNDGNGNPSNDSMKMHYADYGLYIGAISPNVNYVFKNCTFTAYDTHTYTNDDKGYNVYIGGNYSADSITFEGCTFEKSSKHGIGCSFGYTPDYENNIATYYNLTVKGCNFVDWNNGNYDGAAIRGNVVADVMTANNKTIIIEGNTFGNSNESAKANVAIDNWEGTWN